MRRRFVFALGVLATGLGWASGPAVAAPEADLWPRWGAHDPGSTESVDHTPWAAFLERYLTIGADGVNRLAYSEVDPGERARLDQYLAGLEGVAVSGLARPEQMAYWINLYNALTVAVVLDHEPVDSIRDIDISPGFFADGPWGRKLVTIEGEELSLDDIEHRILRPIWQDPRIHYAVNCASIGCPNLAPEPFRANDLEAQLERAAAGYVNDPRGVEIEDGEVTVSRIYDWFQEDFGDSERGVLLHLMRHAEPDLRAQLREIGEIDGYRYDWSLNAVGGG